MKKIIIIIAISIIGLIFLNKLFFTTVPVGKVGIKINTWGGLVEEDFEAGLHFALVGVHEWRYLNKTTMFLHFSQSGDEGEPLIIRTKDNNEIYLDVSIPFKIIKGHAHKLIKGGLERTYQDRMKIITKSVLRAELAKLSPSIIIQTDLREQIAEETLPILNEKLAEINLQAEAILIRSFNFINEKVEKTIQEKQYLRQEKLLKDAQVLENQAKLETNKLETEILNSEKEESEAGNKRIQELQSQYKIVLTKIEAEKNEYEKRTRAEGDAERAVLESQGELFIAESEALKIKLEADILKSKGGKIFIAKQAAENININSLKLNSNIKNPLEIISLKNLLKLVQPE
ncbi:hypothetical protein JXR93_10290 [bacterium]|nr:hypothetical protein [bacterium]